MALFTDAAVITVDDLVFFESSIIQVASSNAINVDNKINLATSAVGDKLLLWLLNAGASDPQWPTRRVLGLSTVIVTPTLKRWMCFESLSRILAEAYNTQLNTRFQGKWTEYQGEAESAADFFILTRVGIVYKPLPKPAMPLISVQSGNAPAQAIFVQTAWVGASGDESALSIADGATLPDNGGVVIAMAEGALGAPSMAVGWNVYAGAQPESLSRQNAAPLAIGSTWELPATGVAIGSAATDGQSADAYITLAKRIQRG